MVAVVACCKRREGEREEEKEPLGLVEVWRREAKKRGGELKVKGGEGEVDASGAIKKIRREREGNFQWV